MFDPQCFMGSFRHSSPNIVLVAQEYEWIQQRHCDTSSYPCIDFPHPLCHPKNKSQKLSCKEAVTGLQKWKHWDLILGEKNYNHVQRQKASVCNIWQLLGPWYMYICICAWIVFPVHLSIKRSTVVEFKYITSKCLVQFLYMCMGCFYPLKLLCFVL